MHNPHKHTSTHPRIHAHIHSHPPLSQYDPALYETVADIQRKRFLAGNSDTQTDSLSPWGRVRKEEEEEERSDEEEEKKRERKKEKYPRPGLFKVCFEVELGRDLTHKGREDCRGKGEKFSQSNEIGVKGDTFRIFSDAPSVHSHRHTERERERKRKKKKEENIRMSNDIKQF